jgi:acetyl esterase/lipase
MVKKNLSKGEINMEIFKLWKNVPGLCEEEPVLEFYPALKKSTDATVVICPGGGYAHRAPHEGQGYAEYFNTIGMNAFVCQYRVSPHRFPLPLLDIRRAIRYVRANAESFGIDPEQVYIMGSSAGGHLTALSSTYFEPIELENTDEIDKLSCIPNGQILCYPVITTGEYTHVHSTQRLCGKFDKDPIVTYTREEADRFSLELHVKENTPPTFLWHTAADQAVPVENSLLFACALSRAKVPFELHIFPEGPHGLSLCNDLTMSGNSKYSVPHNACWIDLACKWARELTI